mgnify:CR=1 FL=1
MLIMALVLVVVMLVCVCERMGGGEVVWGGLCVRGWMGVRWRG